MPTSIGNLVDALEDEAPYLSGPERQIRDSAGALGELGRALRHLAQDGLDPDLNGPRETLAHDLAESCTHNAATVRVDRDGRLTNLAGGLADGVGALRQETGRDERWAITAEVASVVRVLSTYAADGDGRRTADLAWTHLTARTLIAQALQDPPSVQSRAVLDRALPQTMAPPQQPPSRTALESLTVISDRLRRSSAGLTHRPTLLEIFAVTRAAESTSRYATTVAGTLAGRPAPDARPSAAIWHEVRDRLQPFTTSAPLQIEDRDLGDWALRAHSALRQEFGTADRPQLRSPNQAHVKVAAVRDLQAMMNELPAIADHLATAVEQLADHNELHALTRRLPFREHHLKEFLGRRAVVADRFDVMPVIDRLGEAAKLTAELATVLDHASGPAVEARQPALLAANAVRATANRPDPLAALMDQVREVTPAAARVDDTSTNADRTMPELRNDHVDDADHAADVDYGLE